MINEEGWGNLSILSITPLTYPTNGYKNIAFVEIREPSLFLVNNVLSMREWLPLMGITLPLTLIPGDIIAPIKEELPIEVAIELIIERTIDSLVQEIVRRERYSLRPEKKRPWSIKTRRPFRGKIDKVEITFRERIELAERVARELGAPYFNKTSNSGQRG